MPIFNTSLPPDAPLDVPRDSVQHRNHEYIEAKSTFILILSRGIPVTAQKAAKAISAVLSLILTSVRVTSLYHRAIAHVP